MAFVGDNVANYNSGAAATSGVVKAGPGTLYTICVSNANAAARFIQFYNTTSVPADAAVPFLTIQVAATASKEINLGVYGIAFSTGICWATSTTQNTKTIAAAEAIINVTFS